jgi:HlyD family secretion protein
VVRAGEALVEIGDLSHLEIVADYLSADAVRIEPGMPAIVERWGGGDPLRAVVRLIEPSGFVKISALGVEEQRVNVILDFDGPRERRAELGDGYRVEVRVVLFEADVLTVPASALFRQGEGWAAFVIGEDGTARTQPVGVGQRTGTLAEVRAGLDAGARVVLHPSDRVVDGVSIEAR